MKANKSEVKNGFWAKVRKTGRKVPFVNDAIALFDYICDGNVHPARKAVALGALAYFICPVDAIPDVIPVLGLSDDASVIALAVAYYNSEIAPYYER